MNIITIQPSFINLGYTAVNSLQIQESDSYTRYTCIRNIDSKQYQARNWKCSMINNDFNKLRKIKLYNILPIADIDYDKRLIIAQDKSSYSLFYQKDILKQDSNKQKRLIIAGALSIVLQELNRRGVMFNNINLKTIILFDNHVFLQQFDFDFSQEQSQIVMLNNFNEVVSQLFDQEFKFESFQDSSIYFMQQLGIYSSQREWMPYSDMLQNIFSFKEQNVNQLGSPYSNSFIFEWKEPEIFNKNVVIIKSSKQDHYQDKDYYLRSIQRELEIYEGFSDREPFANCFAYMRIETQIYFFLVRYQCDLEMAMNNGIYERNIIPLCFQIIQIIRILHQYQIMHRDLKPANFFLDSVEVDRAKIYLGDFDNSRHMSQSDQIIQDLDPQDDYNNHDFSTDIWQLGLICVYPVEKVTREFTKNDLMNEFTFEKINEKLSINQEQQPLPRELIEIVVDCLKYDKNQRPSANEIYKRFTESVLDDEFNKSELSTNSQLVQQF